jgi:hypothetical protein
MQGRSRQLIPDVRRFSVINLARQYHHEPVHANHVAHLAVRMLEQLDPDAGGDERALLWAAAQLHDIGMAVDYRNHHRHSEYLLLNGGLDGNTLRSRCWRCWRAITAAARDAAPFAPAAGRDEARACAWPRCCCPGRVPERGRHHIVRDAGQAARRRCALVSRRATPASSWDAGNPRRWKRRLGRRWCWSMEVKRGRSRCGEIDPPHPFRKVGALASKVPPTTGGRRRSNR